MAVLTVRRLSSLKPGKWESDGGVRGAGTLVARRLAGGVLFYFRYTNANGQRDVIPLGQWDGGVAGAGLSLEGARKRAAALSVRYREGDRDLRAALDADERERQRERLAADRRAEAESAKAEATMERLLTGYVAQLERDEKPSAREVQRTIFNHVRDAWPKLWLTPAAEIGVDDLVEVIGRLASKSKLREAAKLRSYINAAFNAAIRARQDARGLPALRALGITQNPAANLVTIEGATNARERYLSVDELRAYWRRVVALPEPDRGLLAFHVLTGGQRVKQLARLTMDKFDPDELFVRMKDIKGRRQTPRLHDVPLIPAALDALNGMGHEKGPFVFTVTNGESGALYHIVQQRVNAIVDAMEQAGELEKGRFTPGDLRRTIETRLSAIGIQPHEMAQLQSHGISGVQARHYNRHDYLREKRAALEALYVLLTGKGAKVTSITRSRKIEVS